MKINRTKKQNKGVALLWAMVVTLVMLIITGSMAGLIIKELRMSLNIDLSEQAYAAARSGIEVGSKIKCDAGGARRNFSGALDASGSVTYFGYTQIDAVSGNCVIESTGASGRVSRKLVEKKEPSFGSSNVMSFIDPDGSGNDSDLNRTSINNNLLTTDTPAVNDYNLTHFRDKGTILAGAPIRRFYQQFDLTLPTTPNTSAFVGTVFNNGSAHTAYFVAGTNESGTFYYIFNPTGVGTNILNRIQPSAPIPSPLPSKVRFKISYNGSVFSVRVLDMSDMVTYPDGKCLAFGRISNASGYQFNEFATYVSGSGLTPAPPSSGSVARQVNNGISLYNTGALLENMVLK